MLAEDGRFEAGDTDCGVPLTEQQYQELCRLCDEILLEPDAAPARLAIPFLHVVREHPVFLEEYEELFGQAPGPKNGKELREPENAPARLWRVLHRGLRLIQECSQFRTPRWHDSGNLARNVDFLIVSHLVNRGSIGQENDFYYGGLPEELQRRGHSVVVALIDQVGAASARAARAWRGPVPRAIIPARQGLLVTLAELGRLARERRALQAGANRLSPGLRSRILRKAAHRATSVSAVVAALIGESIGRLAGRIQARIVVMTYEGHAWERVAMRSVRRHNAHAVCVGYNHAGVFRLQHAMRRPLAADCNPDRVLVAGERSLRLLAGSPGLRGTPLGVLGSDRGVASAQTDPIPAFPESFEGVRPTCLVLPEGIVSECLRLMRFSLRSARSNPGIRFLWRLHPVLDYDHLLGIEPDFGALPDNIEVSERSLDNDIILSQWALYRGTTAVFKAVAGGLRPIYYGAKEELTIDPLFELRGWRKVVGDLDEFNSVINADMRQPPRRGDSEFQEALAYCVSHYAPFDAGILEDLKVARDEAS